jgi:hypothetical protein
MWLVILWTFAILLLIGLITTRGDLLGLLNFIILQWTFFRYVRVEDAETLHFKRWGWQGPVVPLTGWWTAYIPSNPPIIKTKEEKEAEERAELESPLVKRKRKSTIRLR